MSGAGTNQIFRHELKLSAASSRLASKTRLRPFLATFLRHVIHDPKAAGVEFTNGDEPGVKLRKEALRR